MAKNLSKELKEYLPQRIFNLLRYAGDKSSKLGQEVFLVGGVVRDLFLARANFDLDLVIEGDAIKLAQELAKSSQVKLIAHHRFGTAKLNFFDFTLDIAAARRETYSRPGALPDVQPGTVNDDLFRRDFSVNAMALCLAPERFGELIDHYHGQDDIANRLIRVLHSKSFIDDATRIFRAIRYEQRLGFTLEPKTAELLVRDAAMIRTISGDRIRHELILMLMEEFPEQALKRSGELVVLSELHPSLKGSSWLSEKFEQTRQFYKLSSSYPLYLCLLIYNLAPNENDQFLSRLNFPKKLSEAMRQTLQLKAQLDLLAKTELKPSDIYQLLHGYTAQAIQTNMLAVQSEVIKQRLQLYLTKWRYVRPLLTGEDLKEMGVPHGPKLGKILSALYEAKLNGQVRTRKGEEKLVRSWLGSL
jgi:tRNA nucleotidyltransferase (CCA-adding enzyme)